MLKSIGIIGYGFVGRACHIAFQQNAEPVIVDPKIEGATWDNFTKEMPPITFVALPAPTLEDRSVDASLIYSTFEKLVEIGYKGIVILKSTLPPDIVDDLYQRFGGSRMIKKKGDLRYVYSPEFIREAHWESDALNPEMIVIAGDYHDCKEIERIYKDHSHLRFPRFKYCDYKEAALVKYAINSFLANKVVFMNQLYRLYMDVYGTDYIHPESWNEFTNILSSDIRIGDSHMAVPGPDQKFGYGGSCFPKDVKAMIGFDKNDRMSLLKETELVNTKIRLADKSK